MNLNRYETKEVLGSGGMGEVYLAYDKFNNIDVAIKFLQRIDGEQLAAFKKEFRGLSEIIHPNLVTLYDLIFDNDQWCIAMEAVRGLDFLTFIKSGFNHEIAPNIIEPLRSLLKKTDSTLETRIQRLDYILPQLIQGVAFLHSKGIIHRDLKPANVLISNQGRLVILDFGLIREKDVNEKTKRGLIKGTVDYIAPEIFENNSSTEAVDWYAIGIMLYEALSDQSPFSGSISRIIEDKISKNVTPLSQIIPNLDPKWSNLVSQLLERDPQNRISLEKLSEIFKIKANKTTTSYITKGLDEIYLGRENELEILNKKYLESKEGKNTCVFINGRSGIGKSALIQQFIKTVEQDEQTIALRGRCYEHEYLPFKAIDSLVDSLIFYLKTYSNCKDITPKDIGPLVSVFPVAQQIPDFAETASLQSVVSDPLERNKRAASALCELLYLLSLDKNILIYIDNLQWGDAESASLVYNLLNYKPNDSRLMLVTSSRIENRESSIFHKKLEQLENYEKELSGKVNLELEALNQSESINLARKLFISRSLEVEKYAQIAADESKGNPLLLREIVRFILDKPEKAIALKDTGQLSLENIFWQRVQALSSKENSLLSIIAVSGHPIDELTAFEVAGFKAIDPAISLSLRTENLLRTIGDSSEIETYHDRVRESILAKLSKDKIIFYHQALVNNLSTKLVVTHESCLQFISKLEIDGFVDTFPFNITADQAQKIYQVAYHYYCSKNFTLAANWGIIAAAHARSVHAINAAINQLELVKNCINADQKKLTLRINLELARNYYLAGRFDAGEKLILSCRDLCETQLEKAQVEGALADMKHYAGDNPGATKCLIEAIKLCGGKVPSSSLGRYFSLVWYFLPQVPIIIKQSLVDQEKLKPLTPIKDFEVHCLSRAGEIAWFEDTCLAFYLVLRAANISNRNKITTSLPLHYQKPGLVMSIIGFKKTAKMYNRLAVKLLENSESLFEQAALAMYNSVNCMYESRLAECQELAAKSVNLSKKSGYVTTGHLAQYQGSYACFLQGKIGEAVLLAEDLLDSANKANDPRGQGIAYALLALIKLGDYSKEIVNDFLVNKQNHSNQVKIQLMQAIGIIDLYNKNYSSAINYFNKAIDIIIKERCFNHYTLPVVTWLVTAWRMKAEGSQTSKERQRALKQAKKIMLWSSMITLQFKNDRCHNRREASLIANLEDKKNKAINYFNQSIQAASRINAVSDKYQTLYMATKCFPETFKEKMQVEFNEQSTSAEYLTPDYKAALFRNFGAVG